ncbi:hypothetical protein LTR74_018403 [Friedmanniomyces endolithicus]|nr:hypothetical protein LTR74_018403 [Friedmanniomyces endolithicus]
MFATFTLPPRPASRTLEYRFVAVDASRFKDGGTKRRRKRTTTAPLQLRASSPQSLQVHILHGLHSTEIDETEQIAVDVLHSTAPMQGLYTTPVVPLDPDPVVSPGAFLESRAGTPVGVPRGAVQSSTPTVDTMLHPPSLPGHSAMLYPPHWDGHMTGDSLLNELAQTSSHQSTASAIRSIKSSCAPNATKKLLARLGATVTPSTTSHRKEFYNANFNSNELAANDQQGSPHALNEEEVMRPSTPPPSVTQRTRRILSHILIPRIPDPELVNYTKLVGAPSTTSKREVSCKANFNHDELAADDQQGSPHASKEQEVIRPSTPPPSVTRSTSPIVLIPCSELGNSSKQKVTRSTHTRLRSCGLRTGYDRRCEAQEAQGDICGFGRPLAPHPSFLGVSTYPAHLHLLRHRKQLNAQETQTRKQGVNPSRFPKQVITWTKHDDTRLLQLRDENELSWQRISGAYFIGVDQAWLHSRYLMLS